MRFANPSEIGALSAAESARLVRAGALTSEQLVRAALDRAVAREPELHAWSHLDASLAIAQARSRDGQEASGPLHGVPIAIKDLIDVAGMPTTNGSPIYQGNLPRADASCVALLRAAGAVILGKTKTVEFGASHPTRTRNPRHLDHTPGGSSSGSAAAVGDNQVAAALGTQTGGSVIRPAAFCGLVGFKPSFGRLCLAGTKMCAWSLDTLGILARHVEDASLLFGVLSGEVAELTAGSPSSPRIGVFLDPCRDQADQAAHAAIDKAANRLEAEGMRLSLVEAPAEFRPLRAAQRTIARFEMARSLAYEWNARRELLSDSTRRELEEGRSIPHRDYVEAKAQVERARPAVDRLFDDVDLMMTFAATGEAPRGLATTGSVLFNGSWTALGVPCLTIPVSTGPSGLPVGVQLIGRFGNDLALLRAAMTIERSLSREAHAHGSSCGSAAKGRPVVPSRLPA